MSRLAVSTDIPPCSRSSQMQSTSPRVLMSSGRRGSGRFTSVHKAGRPSFQRANTLLGFMF